MEGVICRNCASQENSLTIIAYIFVFGPYKIVGQKGVFEDKRVKLLVLVVMAGCFGVGGLAKR